MKCIWLQSLLEPVLDRSTRERDTEARVQLERRLSDLTLRVLDGLRLVEDHHVPLDLRELLLVSAKQGEGRDDEIGVLVELTVGAVVDRDLQAGTDAEASFSQLRSTLRGATTSVFSRIMHKAWIVFPRPISSAKTPPISAFRRKVSQLMPVCW